MKRLLIKVNFGIKMYTLSNLKVIIHSIGECFSQLTILEILKSLLPQRFYRILIIKLLNIFCIFTRWNHLFMLIWTGQVEKRIKQRSNFMEHLLLLWALSFILQTRIERSINWEKLQNSTEVSKWVPRKYWILMLERR